MNSNQLRWFYLILLSIIWGSSYILMKKSLIGLTPIQVGTLRMILTALVLFPFGFKSIIKLNKKEWSHIFTVAFLGTFFPVFMFAYAIQHIDSSITSILNSVTPLLTLIIGAAYYGFTFLKKQIIGIVLGLAGAVFLILKGAQINPGQDYTYAILVIIASAGYAFNVNILKKYLSHISAISITTGSFVILFLPALLILWQTDFFKTEFNSTINYSIFYIFILALFGTAIAKTLFNKLVQISSPIFSSSVTYLIPVVAIFWGVMDGETLHLSQILAGIFILIGIYMANNNKT